MAYTRSADMPISQSYTLGKYTFSVQTTVDGDRRIIQGHCSGPDGTAAHGVSVATDIRVKSWYLRANDTTADIHVNIVFRDTTIRDVFLSDVGSFGYSYTSGSGTYWPNIAVYADFPARVSFSGLNAQTASPITLSYYAAKDIYIGDIDLNGSSPSPIYGPVSSQFPPYDLFPQGHAMEQHESTRLVARFAIDLSDAGGTGEDSDWNDPGDEPDDWEPEDPTYTLNLEVVGALSGRHNDPLNDTSYSYMPRDNETTRPYGCGGNGGYGGGGGAGAANVVVFKFATSRANSKEIVAKAKRHGYGSGGGKGGKGGPGCILIYY